MQIFLGDVKQIMDKQTELYKYIDQVKNKKFALGEFDCCTFSNEAIKSMTNKNYMDDIADYTNSKSALRVIKKYGSLEKALTKKFGLPRENILFAQRGDIVLFEHESFKKTGLLKQAVGICVGVRIVCCSLKGVI